MYSYYLQRGHKLDDLLNLSYLEKVFYTESMLYQLDLQAEKYKVMAGGK